MKVLDYTVEIHDERTGDATAHELISVKGKLVVENSAGRREYDIVFYNGGDTVVYLSPAFPENARFFEAVEAFIGEEGVDPGGGCGGPGLCACQCAGSAGRLSRARARGFPGRCWPEGLRRASWIARCSA